MAGLDAPNDPAPTMDISLPVGGRTARIMGVSALAIIVITGTALRSLGIQENPLWCDEAESSINALTILEHGVPVERYQGQPLFENMLVRPWPDHPEYEFRDVSYSDRGLAIYHAWLPLYAIAGVMAVAGIGPDDPDNPPLPGEVAGRFDRRTWVPRLPSLVFSVGFMLLLFLFGRELGGIATGYTALIAGSLAHLSVWFGSQARYYSLTLLLLAAGGLAAWHVLRRGKGRDFILLALLLALLFHTHILACAILVLLSVATAPWTLRHDRAWRHTLLAAGILAIGTVPWILATGFLETAEKIPSAWSLLDFPRDLTLYVGDRLDVVAGLLVAFAVFVGVAFHNRILPQPLRNALRNRVMAYAFLAAWLLIAFLAFHRMIPAASFFFERMTLLVEVPGILLASMVVADAAKAVGPRWAFVAAPATMMLFLVVTDRIPTGNQPQRLDPVLTRKIIVEAASRNPGPETRLYATPNDHLVLQYYTGLPFQSIAPVRASFLDSWPGPVVLAERFPLGLAPSEDAVREALVRSGLPADDSEVGLWRSRIHSRSARKDATARYREVIPPLDDMQQAPELRRLVNDFSVLQQEEADFSYLKYQRMFPPFRGFTVRSHRDWWHTFFYRFVDPVARNVEGSNHANRLSDARAEFVAGTEFLWIESPARERTVSSEAGQAQEGKQ
jgi:hypothetical protein